MEPLGTRLKLRKDYSIVELFELIKDVDFEAGHPELKNHGPTKWIVFPQLNRYNQVIIGGRQGKFYVQCTTEPIGIGDPVSNNILNTITSGLNSFSISFGKTKKRCEKLAESVGNQINDMDL